MKIKCPFCKEPYDLTDEDIVSFGGHSVQCIKCNARFRLYEVAPCLKEYRRVMDIQKSLDDTNSKLAQEKESLKNYKRADQYDYMDDERFERESVVVNIQGMKQEIEDLKEELKEAKAEYNECKKDLPKLGEARMIYSSKMFELFERGLLVRPLDAEDKERLLRVIMMGNEGYDMVDTLILNKLYHCLAGELYKVCEALLNDKYLPLPKHNYSRDGSITEKQFHILESFGLKPEDIKTLSKEDATWTITTILNKENEAKEEWLERLSECESREEMLEAIREFESSPVIVPPPKPQQQE